MRKILSRGFWAMQARDDHGRREAKSQGEERPAGEGAGAKAPAEAGPLRCCAG